MLKRYDNEISGPGILNFHYDREERLARSPRAREFECALNTPRPRGFFRRAFGGRRGSMLVLVDVAVLCLFFVILRVIAPPDGSSWDEGGFRFLLSAFSHEGKAFVSLRVTKQSGEVYRGLLPEVVFEAEGESSENLIAALPSRKGGLEFTRSILPLPQSLSVSCTVSFNGTRQILSADIKRDSLR